MRDITDIIAEVIEDLKQKQAEREQQFEREKQIKSA